MLYRRPRSKGETFFFTLATRDRRPVLCERSSILSMREALRTVGSRRPFSLNAFVLLPDHLHCIWTMPENDSDYRIRWSEILSGFACCRPKHGRRKSPGARNAVDFWQTGFGEHHIADDLDFVNHVEYIHYDPVKHGLVERPASWPHSTFHRYVERGLYLPDWGSSKEIILPAGIGCE